MMPDYHPHHQLSSEPSDEYENWYGRNSKSPRATLSNTDSGYYSTTDSYPDLPQPLSRHGTSRNDPRSKWTPTIDRKNRRWPPQPSVEDEVTALSKELGSTIFIESSRSASGERGSIDQQPIILEADPPVQPSEAPHPPQSAEQNFERRFVQIPTNEERAPNQHVPRDKAVSNDDHNRRGRREQSKFDTDVEHQSFANYFGERKPSPYAISGNRLSGEYFASPDVITPAQEYPITNRRRHDSLSSGGRHSRETSFEESELHPGDSASNQGRYRRRQRSSSRRQTSPNPSSISSPKRSPRLEPVRYHDPPTPNGGPLSRRQSNNGLRPTSPLSPEHPYSSRSSQHYTHGDRRHDLESCIDGRRSRSASPSPPPTQERSYHGSGPQIDIQKTSSIPDRVPAGPLHSDPPRRRPSPTPIITQKTFPLPYRDSARHRPSLGPQLTPRSPSASDVDVDSRRPLVSIQASSRSASSVVRDRRKSQPRSSDDPTHVPTVLRSEPRHGPDVHRMYAAPPPTSRSVENPQSTGPRSPQQQTVQVSKASTGLPPCPRSQYIAGYHDWSSLAGFPSFDICPGCAQAAMAVPQYRQCFVKSPPRDPKIPIKCDFSSPWIRHAWALTLQQGRPNLDLVYGVASVETTEVPCPGNAGAIAPWSNIIDPSTRRPVHNFDICPYCVRNAEASMPSLRGAFVRAHHSDPSQLRFCDLRSNSRRFPSYISLLEAATFNTEAEHRQPDLRTFVAHVRTRASLRECSRDDMVLGQTWHVMPRLPQFTVCEECYHDVVWPAVAKGSHLADMFDRSLQHAGTTHQGVSCQLYSPRMRWVFEEAVQKNDFEGLKTAVLDRVKMESVLQARHKELQGMLKVSERGFGIRGFGIRGNNDRGMGRDDIIDEIARIAEEWKRWE